MLFIKIDVPGSSVVAKFQLGSLSRPEFPIGVITFGFPLAWSNIALRERLGRNFLQVWSNLVLGEQFS